MKYRATLLETRTADAVVDQVQAAVRDDSAVDELRVARLPVKLENTRFVVIELRRLEDGARDEVRILELVLRSNLAKVALLKLPDVEDMTGGVVRIVVAMSGSHKLRDLARTYDLFHLNDFQDSLVRAVPNVRNRNFHFVLPFSLDAASAAAEKEDAIHWMDMWMIPEEFARGNIRASVRLLGPDTQTTLKSSSGMAAIHSQRRYFHVRLHFVE
ncbi:hypothetical protein [Paraburkholderia fungorum]|uniref:hypothetical protein n=1 Tax=Paraburkholderia fungorum TaxID=134537 RepID=UPI0011AE1890|nr:hypothetical protein [Paraburkholderia fungorum]